MKRIAIESRLGFSAVLGALVLACGGGNADKPAAKNCVKAKGEALVVARPDARIFLTSSLLPRLKARRAAGEAAWTDLAKTCDGLASGTVNAPTGAPYPNPPNLGQGYQGENYLPAIAALGLCYRTTSGVDETAAARYGAAGARVLEAMSTPVGSGGQAPQTDSGYGIRNYGVGMALGYDWLYPALSASTRQRVISSLNAWIDWYDASGFIRNHPIGNYFVGYLLAKTLTAIATEGENSKAASYFSDVSTRLWATLIKPAFSLSMTGGGWPEGWGYGPRAVGGFAEFLWAVKTGKDLDWGAELPQAREQARYLTHFAWPSLLRMDDQGTVRSGNALKPSAALTHTLATILQRFGDPASKQAAALAADITAAAGDDRAPWQKFLYGDPALVSEPYTTQPLSYQASGPGHVAMRSSWQKDAVWAALESGPYINAPDSGEQMFNAGSLSIVIGNNPILINPTGWLPSAAGTAGENFVYEDSWGAGGRRLYNTFFVNDPANPKNPGQTHTGPTESKTRIERYVDNTSFVRVRAAQVENQYLSSVKQYNRDLVYVRPGTFVLFDRTTVADAAADQWLAFHTPSPPAARSSSDATQALYDVSSTAGNGNVRFLLPRKLSVKTVSLPGNSTRLEAHASGAAEQQWLTVIGAGENAGHVRLSAEDGNVHSGGVVGVHVASARQQVVLFSAGHAPSSTIAGAEYTVTQTGDADHVLVDVADAPQGYSASGTRAGGALRIKLTQGGPLRASAAGTLHLVVKESGAVEAPQPETGGSGGSGGSGSGGSGGAPGSDPPTGSGGSGAGANDPCQPNPCGPGRPNETATKNPNEPAPPEMFSPGSSVGVCP